MSFSFYISALAVADTIVLLNGKWIKFILLDRVLLKTFYGNGSLTILGSQIKTWIYKNVKNQPGYQIAQNAYYRSSHSDLEAPEFTALT